LLRPAITPSQDDKYPVVLIAAKDLALALDSVSAVGVRSFCEVLRYAQDDKYPVVLSEAKDLALASDSVSAYRGEQPWKE